jgi:hypothetical protein
MFLYPNTIQSLRHDWTHPAFEDQGMAQSISELWLRNFAQKGAVGMGYQELLDAAKAYLESGDYLNEGGRWEGVYTPDDFWDHYETVTGTKVPLVKRGNFFSCSC